MGAQSGACALTRTCGVAGAGLEQAEMTMERAPAVPSKELRERIEFFFTVFELGDGLKLGPGSIGAP